MRYKYIRYNLDFLVANCVEGKESHFKCIVGLPKGTKFIRFGHDHIGNLTVVVEHESFPDIKEYDSIEETNIMFNKLYCDENVLKALKNYGADIECGACMEMAFTGATTNHHICKD